MKVTVVVNPVKVDDMPQLLAAVRHALPEADVSGIETTQDDPGAGQAREAIAAGAQLVLVCGGDGTITACAGALAGSGVPMGLLPAGTGNLLARNLRLPLDLDEALAVVRRGRTVQLDLIQTSRGPSTVMAGLGLDAAMIRDTDERWKRRLGWLAYVSGVLRSVHKPPTAHYRIAVDDQPPDIVRAVAVLVGNVGELQAGMAVLPDARADDGRIDVIALMPRDAGEIAGLAWRLIRRTTPASSRTVARAGQRVTIVADRAVPLQLDGEYLGEYDSLTADVLPAALTVFAP